MDLQFKDPREQADFEELMRLIKRRECILFLGAGVSREVGLPSGTDLALTLARECEYPTIKPLTLSQVAQHYEIRFGRQRLFGRMQELFKRPVVTRGRSSYDLIVEIDHLNHPIVTTNWDDQLERAFQRKDKSVTLVRYSQQVSFLQQPHAIIKLHGDFGSRLEEIILTRDNYVHAYRQVTQPGGLFAVVGAWLATKTMIFVGYSLEDEDFQLLYDHVREAVGAGARMHYAVMPDPSPVLRDYWRSQGITILDCKALDFFEEVFIRTRRFVNREDELEYICTRATKPYIEVYGFAGCGKTELLREVWDRYGLTGTWVRACVSFEKTREEVGAQWGDLFVSSVSEAFCKSLKEGTDPLDLAAEIARQTMGRELKRERLLARAREDLAAEKGVEVKDVPESKAMAHAEALAAQELGDYLAHQHTLFLFDSSERVLKRILRWTEWTLIPTLEEKVLNPKKQLRFVFAGRSPLTWRSPRIKRSLYVRKLTPFNAAAIGAMLDSFAALKLRDPLPRARRSAIVKGVLNLSSGHPKCIRNLLAEITGREFDIPSDYFEREKVRLFEEHVAPVVETEILGKVGKDVHDIFPTICAFRRLSTDVLDVLMREGYIDKRFPDALALLGQLGGTYLLGKPEPPPMYLIDSVVRRALAMKLELTAPDRYRVLNELAMNTFEKWIIEVAVREEQLAYIIEALFHRLQLLRVEGRSGDEVEQELRSKLKGYLKKLRPTEPRYRLPLLEKLKEQLEGDEELLDGVADLVPGDGYRTLVDLVDEAYEQLLEEV